MRGVIQKILPIAVLGCCALLLWPTVQALDTAAMLKHWQAIGAMQWVVAAACTIVSFWAVSQYDVLAHRQLGTGLDPREARRVGITAIAISQTTGFGLVVAMMVRWRGLTGFGPGVAAQITAFVSLMFMAALTAMAALLCLILPTPAGLIWPAIGTLAVLAALACAAVLRPRFRWKNHVLELPSLRAMSAAAGWACTDVVAAGAAFYAFVPPEIAPPFWAMLPIFCVSLAAGLFSGTPGGVGPFEVTMLALTATGMPAALDPAVAVVAIFGFRLVYFLVPALLALLSLLLPRPSFALWQDPPPPHVSDAYRAETAVITQTGGTVERIGPVHCGIWQTGQALVAMFDPFERMCSPGFIKRLSLRATESNRLACLYKCSPRTALQARMAGWAHLHLADDAIVELATYTLDSPARARLRRKLRKAQKARLSIRRAGPDDLAALAEIDNHWTQDHGKARGGTMGRFSPDYVRPQAVLLAEVDGAPVAFVSFHVSGREWALDVMRHKPALPDGTMHALVHAGIQDAQEAGAQHLSLSAVIACPNPDSAIWRWLTFKMAGLSGAPGLRQFKSAFAPRWQPLYAAAPSRLGLAICLADIAREVRWPVALPAVEPATLHGNMSPDHKQNEDYEVASSKVA